MNQNPYKLLGLTVGIHFFVMFALTYVGVFEWAHVYLNLNRFYMALIMVAPMVILMLFFMRKMYTNKKLNLALYVVSAIVFVGGLVAIRAQTFVGNEQFLKSMIPHHSIAIKTCKRANISDPEIRKLCGEIVKTQKEEIAQMEDILRRINE